MPLIAVRFETLSLKLDSAELRRVFPSRLRELAGGVVVSHASDIPAEADALLFTFEVADPHLAVEIVANLIEKERILGHDLQSHCTIAVKRGAGFDVVFPHRDAATKLE